MDGERRLATLRAEYAEARALVLDARVSLYATNFGDAIERLQQAQTLVGRVQTELREMGEPAQAGQLEVALAHLREAQHQAALLDVRAQGPATEALATLDAVRGGK
jgi:hypothetical protein